jgi:hypothetical protein
MPRKGIHKPRSRSRTHRRAVWLTRRELEVLGLMATGMKNREISAALSGLARHAHLGGELCLGPFSFRTQNAHTSLE